MNDARLQDRRAVITGAAGGIGAAIARGFAARGAQVIVADRDASAAEDVALEIRSTGGIGHAVPVDVTDEASIEALFTRTEELLGGVDVLVNGAGVLRRTPFLDTTEADWDLAQRVNALGPMLCTKVAGRRMISQGTSTRGAGKIVNVCSTSSRRPSGAFTAYAASKASVLSLTQSTAKALAPFGITVNGLGPGIVDTPLWRGQLGADDATLADYVAQIPLGRLSSAEDVVPTAVFLASDDSDYMTGQLLMIDGGMVMA